MLHVKSECSQLVINCPHCLVRGEKHFIEGRHLEECSNCPLSCPNHCGATISSSEFDEHKNICPLEVVSCEFNSLGCNTDMPRRDVETHDKENLTNHLNLAKQQLACSTKELESSKMQLKIAEQSLASLKVKFAYSIEEVLTMIRLLDQLNLEQQKTEKSHLFRQISLYYKSLLLLQSDNQVAPVILKMNQFENHRRNGRSWSSPPFYIHKRGYRLVICVGVAGYGATPGKNNCLSLSICLMQGHYDNELSWPMEGVVRVCILNQLYSEGNDMNHGVTICLPDTPLFPVNAIKRVTTGSEENSIKTPMGLMASTVLGTSQFISLEKLTKSSSRMFLKDDCIFFKVEYGKSLDNLAIPKSYVYKELESTPIKKDSLHFYNTPQQDSLLTFEAKKQAPILQNRPMYQSSVAKDDGAANTGVQRTPAIPETITSL